MDLAPYHLWIVWIHVVGVFLFLIGHGVSIFVAFRLRTEREPVRSNSARPFTAQHLDDERGARDLVPGRNSGRFLRQLLDDRSVLDLGLADSGDRRRRDHDPHGSLLFQPRPRSSGRRPETNQVAQGFVVDEAALDAAIMSGKPMVLATAGFGLIIVLSWLMFFKPF